MNVPTTINGFTVIAHKESHGRLTVLGHRFYSGRHEYVVGRNVHPDGKSWGSGHYTHDLATALTVLEA